jgi:hypothetical protein
MIFLISHALLNLKISQLNNKFHSEEEIIVQCLIRVSQCTLIMMLSKNLSNLETEREFQVTNCLETNMKKMMKQKQDIINYKEPKQSQAICFSVKSQSQIKAGHTWETNSKDIC